MMTRATRLTKQLLTLAKGGAPVREDTRLGGLVKEIVQFDLSGSNVMPMFKEAKDLWMADVDKGQIQPVFSKLAINADQVIFMYQQAQEAGTPFDIVIMDLTIPGGMGGKEAIKDLLNLDPGIRAIVSSGYADDPVMTNPIEYGFMDRIEKPYTKSLLEEVVGRVFKG